jgi:hypothetical protein
MTTCRAADGNGLTCTDKPGHTDEHVAEGPDNEIISMWATENNKE